MPQKTEPKDFETAVEKLEKIVNSLEEGEMKLEDSLSAFEEGMKLAKFAEGKLSEASGRVEKVMHDFSSDLEALEAPVEEIDFE
jgi:exodeoxyribonuclease VII small subunit